jgi:hypothetical protein
VFGQMNEPPGARARVALTGLTIAEYFRDEEGQDVLLFIDNIFRFTQAGSEVGHNLTVKDISLMYVLGVCPARSYPFCRRIPAHSLHGYGWYARAHVSEDGSSSESY